LATMSNRRRKLELLVLFPLDMAILRLMSISTEMSTENIERIDAMFGDHGWWDIYQSRRRGQVKPSLAKRMYLDMYTSNVQELGYQVQSKRIIAPRRWGIGRHEMYHLVFATAHPTGDKIMTGVFKRPFALDFPVTGQRPLEM
jgi:three-Cys-motif partner protein